jgi:hypothetical protein
VINNYKYINQASDPVNRKTPEKLATPETEGTRDGSNSSITIATAETPQRRPHLKEHNSKFDSSTKKIT